MKSLEDLPTQVGLFQLISEWDGPKKYTGKNWLIRCTDCKTDRVTSTSIWNAAAKGTYKMLCQCQRKGVDKTGRRASKYLHYNGASATVQEWAERTGIAASSIYSRLTRRKSQHPNHAAPDEWVIFGEDPDHIRRFKYVPTEDEKESAAVASLLIALQNDVIRMLRPVIAEAINVHIKPCLLNSTTPIGRLLPAKDPGYAADGCTYNPDPHPLDDEPFCKDANYRQAREYWGDASVAEIWETMRQYPKTCEHYRESVWINPPPAPPKPATVTDSAPKTFTPDPNKVYCIPEHTKSMWHESMSSVTLTQPIPDEFPKQEDTSPLTQIDIDHYLNTPWWQARQSRWRLHQHNFGFVCRTQYERIKAYLQPPKKDYPGPADYAISFAKGYQWTVDHRSLNEFLDFCAIRDWYEEHRNTTGYFDNAITQNLLSGRYMDWMESDDPNLQKQARHLPEWFPFLKGDSAEPVDLPEPRDADVVELHPT